MIIDIIINIIVYTLKVLMFFYDLINTIENFATDSKIIFPLILSLISALIFWIIFSYLPTYKRKKQLRPIIEYDFMCLNQSLFNIFNTVLGSNPSFQEEVRSGNLTKKDFYIGLQNKCLNEYDLYDSNVSSHYEMIGLKLAENFNIAERIIDKILTYNEFATPNELLILEKIRQKLKAYSITEKRVNLHKLTKINSQIIYPPVSNLNYLYNNIYELYELFNIIQEIIYRNDYLDRSALFQKLQYLYYSGQYKECKKLIKKNLKKYSKEIVFLSHYDLMCDSKLNSIDYKKVEKVLKRRDYDGGLVYSRGTIKVLIKDKKTKELIEKYYSNEEIKYCEDTIEQEQKQKDSYIEINTSISKYMEEKDTRYKNINWNE